MRRLDFIGVPGTGKTTAYKALKEIRKPIDGYLLFEEAYNKVISPKIPTHLKFWHRIIKTLPKTPITEKTIHKLLFIFDNMLEKEKNRVENSYFESSIFEMANKYPAFMQITLNGIGYQSIAPQGYNPEDYFISFKKILTRMNQYNILEQSISKDAITIFDSSFSHKVFSIVDFSRQLEPETISRYFEGMPRPWAVALFNLPPEDIVDRIRKRASEGSVNAWHRSIVNTDLLFSWVEFACEVTSHARAKLLSLGIPIIDIDAANEPTALADQIRDFILLIEKENC